MHATRRSHVQAYIVSHVRFHGLVPDFLCSSSEMWLWLLFQFVVASMSGCNNGTHLTWSAKLLGVHGWPKFSSGPNLATDFSIEGFIHVPGTVQFTRVAWFSLLHQEFGLTAGSLLHVQAYRLMHGSTRDATEQIVGHIHTTATLTGCGTTEWKAISCNGTFAIQAIKLIAFLGFQQQWTHLPRIPNCVFQEGRPIP